MIAAAVLALSLHAPITPDPEPFRPRVPVDTSGAVLSVQAWCDWPSGLPRAEVRNLSPHSMRFAARYAVTMPGDVLSSPEAGYVLLGPWEAVSWVSHDWPWLRLEVWHAEPAPADPHAPVAPTSRAAEIYCPVVTP